MAYAFPFGWIFGRLGCFLAYDHPGAPTTASCSGSATGTGSSATTSAWRRRSSRSPWRRLFLLLARRPRPAGFYLGLLPMAYAPFRFALDFWRLVDVRYGGLTPGQWGCFALFLVGAWLLRRSRTPSQRLTPLQEVAADSAPSPEPSPRGS